MKRGRSFFNCKSGQITVFVIIAIVLVAGIAGLYVFRDKIFKTAIPADMKPIYDYYLSCVEANAKDGASILGTQAGYIEQPEFEQGSEYAPFSNQLDFLGFGVPYWYYVSGNGIIKEQIPSKREMQNQLGNYIKGRLEECDFTEFRRQGYNVNAGDASVKTEIKANEIFVAVSQRLSITKQSEATAEGAETEGNNVIVTNHKTSVASQLGNFYDIASKIYNYEKKNMFLENYAVDVLNLYAPVTGTEITCSPLMWNPYDVIDGLKAGLQANIQTIKIGDKYSALKSNKRKYFIVDSGIDTGDAQINFLYNPDWASRFEVWPTKNKFMIAEVVGPQEGLGVAGFCYVSYKFIYDMYFPVLVQILSSDGEQVFQFPVAVVISKNKPREALAVEPLAPPAESICDNAKTEISVSTYNVNLEPVEADLEFKCFTDVCRLGNTTISGSEARLTTKVPQCVNGIIIANAAGYKEKKYQISTNEESMADIVLDKEYTLDLEVYVDGKIVNHMAILAVSENFNESKELISTTAYPYVSKISLAEGDYNFNLKVYTDHSIAIPETKNRQCAKVLKSGVLGVFGIKEEKCFDYVIPSQTVSQMLYAGGSQNQYVTSGELAEGSKIKVYATSAALPSSVEKLQGLYDIIDAKNLRIDVI